MKNMTKYEIPMVFFIMGLFIATIMFLVSQPANAAVEYESRSITPEQECCTISVEHLDGQYEVRYDDWETNRSNIISVLTKDDVDDLILMHQDFCHNVHHD